MQNRVRLSGKSVSNHSRQKTSIGIEIYCVIVRLAAVTVNLANILFRYYNIGILFYNNKNYSSAAEPLLKCCEIYEEWGQTNPIDEKVLAKRKELVSICRKKSNDVDVRSFNSKPSINCVQGRSKGDRRRHLEDCNHSKK